MSPSYRGLAIIGGGYIGLEMSQFYRRMGSRVVVIEESAQVAGHEDEDIARALQQLLEAEEIEFHLRAQVTSIKKRKDGVALTLKERGAGSTELRASHLFVAKVLAVASEGPDIVSRSWMTRLTPALATLA